MSPTDTAALRDRAAEAVRRLRSRGYTAFWAGGCVRDMLRGRQPRDYDIATDAPPDTVAGLFPGSHTVGKAFAVVRAPVDDTLFEIATFREDHGYADGRHPGSVSFTDARTDAGRRDFTINALFYDPVAETLIDYVGGANDVRAGIVRAVGDPAARFAEDHLRLLRAARFASTLEFSLDPGTAAAIRAHAALIDRVSPERVREELTRILLESPAPGRAVSLLDDLGLLDPMLPEITAMKGQPQPPEFHPEGDVFTHTLIMLDMMAPAAQRCLAPRQRVVLAYAALLHDIGKPMTARQDGDRLRFNGHAPEGAAAAAAVLSRLRFSSEDRDAVTFCIRNHMRLMDVQNMRRSTLRRLVGAPTFAVELELHRLDCLASHGDLSNYYFLVDVVREQADEPILPDPWISGHDIMALGVPEGPEVGQWRNRAYTAQLEGEIASRDDLLKWLRTEIGARDRQDDR
jgi:poly(A) polymerase